MFAETLIACSYLIVTLEFRHAYMNLSGFILKLIELGFHINKSQQLNTMLC